MSAEPGRRHEGCAPVRASLPLSVSGVVSRIALIQNVSAGFSLLWVRVPVNRVGDKMAITGEKTPSCLVRVATDRVWRVSFALRKGDSAAPAVSTAGQVVHPDACTSHPVHRNNLKELSFPINLLPCSSSRIELSSIGR